MVYFAIIVLYNFTMNDFTDLRNRWLQHEEKILKTCRQFKMKKPLGQVHATLNNKTGKIYYTINYKMANAYPSVMTTPGSIPTDTGSS